MTTENTQRPRNKKRGEAILRASDQRKSEVTAKIRIVPVTEYVGEYVAGDDGNIYSARTWRKLAGGVKSNYLGVTLCIDGRQRQHLVHRVVAEAFHGPAYGRQVNHKNGDKLDNRPSNLEWVTRSENQIHAANTGLKPTGEKSHLAKLNESQVKEIRVLLSEGISQTEIGRRYGVSQTAISKIKMLRKWKQLSQ